MLSERESGGAQRRRNPSASEVYREATCSLRSRSLDAQHVDLAAVLRDDQLLGLTGRVGVDQHMRDRAVESNLHGIGMHGRRFLLE